VKLWLDDVRKPWEHGAIGFEWAKTYEQAVDLLLTRQVTFASLDHDLSEGAAMGYFYHCRQCGERWQRRPTSCPKCKGGGLVTHEKTGYDVVCFLEENPHLWPAEGVVVHSMNPSGRARMQQVIDRYYRGR
jgi:hypothetical protein